MPWRADQNILWHGFPRLEACCSQDAQMFCRDLFVSSSSFVAPLHLWRVVAMNIGMSVGLCGLGRKIVSSSGVAVAPPVYRISHGVWTGYQVGVFSRDVCYGRVCVCVIYFLYSHQVCQPLCQALSRKRDTAGTGGWVCTMSCCMPKRARVIYRDRVTLSE